MSGQEVEQMGRSEAQIDLELAVKAQAGDLAAETELLQRYKKLAGSKANMYYMVGADEDDVMQEAMIGLLKAVRQFDPSKDASFHTFAGVCITNQIISAIRAARRNKHEALNSFVSLHTEVSGEGGGADSGGLRLEDTLKADPSENPEQLLMMKDIMECIVHNDDKVFSRYETQVLAGVMRGLSREEIAAELGRTVKSVDNCLQRAKRKIITYLIA